MNLSVSHFILVGKDTEYKVGPENLFPKTHMNYHVEFLQWSLVLLDRNMTFQNGSTFE